MVEAVEEVRMPINQRSLPQIVVLVLASLLTACESTPLPPFRPTPPPGSGAPAASGIHLSGIVTDEHGMPLAGATVRATARGVLRSTMTGPNGEYDLRAEIAIGSGYEVAAERAGYESNSQFVKQPEASQNFRLREVVRIGAGEFRTVVVTPDDTLYGFDYEYRARTVRVSAEQTGMLELEVVSHDSRTPGRLGLGSLPNYPCCPPREVLRVVQGQEVQVNILIIWTDTTASSRHHVSIFSADSRASRESSTETFVRHSARRVGF
jgi:hypothetical protein